MLEDHEAVSTPSSSSSSWLGKPDGKPDAKQGKMLTGGAGIKEEAPGCNCLHGRLDKAESLDLQKRRNRRRMLRRVASPFTHVHIYIHACICINMEILAIHLIVLSATFLLQQS